MVIILYIHLAGAFVPTNLYFTNLPTDIKATLSPELQSQPTTQKLLQSHPSQKLTGRLHWVTVEYLNKSIYVSNLKKLKTSHHYFKLFTELILSTG